MFVTIPNELIAQTETSVEVRKAILNLFNMFFQDDHQWLLEPDDDESLYDTPLLDSYRDYIKGQINRSIYRKPSRLVQVCKDEAMMTAKREVFLGEPEAEFIPCPGVSERCTFKTRNQTHELITLALIDPFLKQPLKLIVENIESDSLFIEKCLLHFADIEPGDTRIKFENGGGSSVIHVAKKLAGKHRVVCIVDSDQESPGVIPADKVTSHKNLREVCAHFGYELHFLSKKEMENYLPESALEKFLTEERNYRNCTEHPYFSKLSPEQRDFFDLKYGLPPTKLHYPIWEELQAAYEEIATTNGKVNGFGKYVWHAFEFVETREELESRDGQGELKQLTEAIQSFM